MARHVPVFFGPLVLLLCGHAHGSDVGDCASEGNCRSEVASDSPISLLQTFTSATSRTERLTRLQSLLQTYTKLTSDAEPVAVHPAGSDKGAVVVKVSPLKDNEHAAPDMKSSEAAPAPVVEKKIPPLPPIPPPADPAPAAAKASAPAAAKAPPPKSQAPAKAAAPRKAAGVGPARGSATITVPKEALAPAPEAPAAAAPETAPAQAAAPETANGHIVLPFGLNRKTFCMFFRAFPHAFGLDTKQICGGSTPLPYHTSQKEKEEIKDKQEEKDKKETEAAASTKNSAAPAKVEKPTPAPSKVQEMRSKWPIFGAFVCGAGAMIAGFVQASLGVYSAMTFHTISSVGVMAFAPYFQITVAQASIYIMCFCPLMDLCQMWHFQGAKRNWAFILGYGIPEFLGLFAGLAVLTYAMSNTLVIYLQGFLLFSCVMCLCNEGYMRYKRLKAEQAAEEAAKSAEQKKEELEGDCPEQTPQDGENNGGGGGGHGGGGDEVCRTRNPSFGRNMLEKKMAQEDNASEADTDVPSSKGLTDESTQISSNGSEDKLKSKPEKKSEPAGIDMNNRTNMVVVVLCGALAGFSLGAISIGGTFVLLMLNTLSISIDEWRVTQCVAETPLHWARAIIVFAVGMISWELDWMNVVAGWIGVLVGLALGNTFSSKIPPIYLRGTILAGIFVTIVCLTVKMVGGV